MTVVHIGDRESTQIPVGLWGRRPLVAKAETERYSAVLHLARTLFLNHDPTRSHMAMFAYSAYFDASGSPNDTVALFVSGAVGSVHKWLKFENEWTGVLDRYDVEQPFHMERFLRVWHENPVTRDEILRQLVTIIKKYTNKQFSTGVILGDWRAVNKEYQLAENLWFPFPLCAMKTLIRLDRWKQHQGIEEPIERVFESGDNHQGAFLEKMRLTEGAPSISFKPKAFTPLQQGDLISWHLARSVRDEVVSRPGIEPGTFRLRVCCSAS